MMRLCLWLILLTLSLFFRDLSFADQKSHLDLEYRAASVPKLFITETYEADDSQEHQQDRSAWGPFHVMGYTEKQVMEMVNNPNGQACSKMHQQGDFANRYCHASVVKVIDRSLQDYGISKSLSALLAGAVFLPKEYLLDRNASKSDLVIADYTLLDKSRTRMEVTAFADGAIFIVLRKKVNL